MMQQDAEKIPMYRIYGSIAQSYLLYALRIVQRAMHFSIKSRPFVQLIHVMIIR